MCYLLEVCAESVHLVEQTPRNLSSPQCSNESALVSEFFILKISHFKTHIVCELCAAHACRQIQISLLSPHFCHPNNLSLFPLSYYSFFPEKSYWTCITCLPQCKSQSLCGGRWDSISAFSRAAPYIKSHQPFFFLAVVPISKHPQKPITIQWVWASLPSTETRKRLRTVVFSLCFQD